MSDTAPYTILLIDDEANILKLYSMLLTKYGYVVYTFDSAIEALEFMKKGEHKIDLIISDLNMPEMTGLQFLNQINKNTKHSSIPLIFLSAVSDSKIHVDAYESGAVDFLTKPVQKEIFLSKIKALLKSYSLKIVQENIYLEGSRPDKEVDDIIAVCEAERISGFAVFRYGGKSAVLHFKGGLLEEIECGPLQGAEALEALSAWETYSFSVFQGRYDEQVVERFLPSQQDKKADPSVNFQKDSSLPLEEGMLEIVHFQDDFQAESMEKSTIKFNPLYQLNNAFIHSVSGLINQKFITAELMFTDNKVLQVNKSGDLTTAIVFENKKFWQRFQEQND